MSCFDDLGKRCYALLEPWVRDRHTSRLVLHRYSEGASATLDGPARMSTNLSNSELSSNMLITLGSSEGALDETDVWLEDVASGSDD